MTTTTADKGELLPCPFCGEQPEIVWVGREDYACCTNRTCEVQPSSTPAAWNRRATTAQATPAGEGVELPIFGTVQTVQGQTAYVLILDREAKIPAYAKLADHATATAEIAKRDAEIEIQRAALKNIRLFAARNRKEDWGLLILGFCAEGGVAGHVLRDGEA